MEEEDEEIREARKKGKKALKKVMKRREKERNAAIKMQSLFRRHKGMIVYQQRLLEDIASTTIQRRYRGVLGRRVANRKRMWQKSEPGPERLELGLRGHGRVTLVEAGNPAAIVRAADLGIDGIPGGEGVDWGQIDALRAAAAERLDTGRAQRGSRSVQN